MTRRSLINGKRGRNSFTLVEMLVSMAILLILVSLLGTMVGSVMTIWEQEQDRGERRTTGRQALAFIAHDLGLAALPLNHSDTNSIQFVIDPSTLSSYLMPQALFWQAPVANDTTSSSNQGNLAIVGYFVRWVGNEGCLCRLLINPSAGTPAGADYGIYNNPSSWVTSTLLDNYAPATSAQSYAGLVGENVLGLWAQALDANGNPIVTTAAGTAYATGAYDSRLGYSVVNSGVTNAYGPSALPAAVRVGIVVVDALTAHRITAPILPAAATTNFFGDIATFTGNLPKPVRQGATVYTEVVQLPRNPQ